jgi:tetratricopeptide (TPR) repeat protein
VGDVPGVEAAVLAAAADARAIGSAERLVRGAEITSRFARYGDEALAKGMSEDALAALGDDQSVLRARALGVYVMTQASTRSRTDEFMRQADEAVALSRECGDADALSSALEAYGLILLGTSDPERLLQVADELEPIAEEAHDAWGIASALRFRAQALMQLGDVVGADVALAALRRLADERRHGVSGGWYAAWDGTRLLMQGRIDEVEAATVRIVADGRDSDPNFVNAFAAQLFSLRREQGRMEEMVPLLLDTVAENPGIPAFRTVLAIAQMDTGHVEETREHFDALAADQFASVPRDLSWTASLMLLSELAAGLDHKAGAAALVDLVRPFSGQLIVIAAGVACLGAADAHLALLLHTLGRDDEAAALFDKAIALEEAVGAPLLVARTRRWQSVLDAGPR